MITFPSINRAGSLCRKSFNLLCNVHSIHTYPFQVITTKTACLACYDGCHCQTHAINSSAKGLVLEHIYFQGLLYYSKYMYMSLPFELKTIVKS